MADPVTAKALECLRCPHCEGALVLADGAVRCPRGHSFDVARQGYVSLLAGASRHAGDSPAMVEAREAFLAAGHFDPIADALAEAAAGVDWEGCVVDVGAGTGWYLARVLELMPERVGLALDVSKPALRRAARSHPRATSVACDAWAPLPLRDAVAAVVLSVFAPRAEGEELARVLRPGGALVVVTPTRRHLSELVDALDLLTVDERKDERLDARLAPALELASRRTVEREMPLAHDEVERLAAMGPSAHHASADLEARVAALPEPLDVTLSVEVSVYTQRRTRRR